MNVNKCSVKAKSHVKPVENSVDTEAGTGTCPVCLTPGVKLSKNGHIGAHAVAVEVDPTLPVVATGTPKGDPRDATVRRAVEARRIAAGADPLPLAENAPQGRDESKTRAPASPGPAMYRGRAMEPCAGPVEVRHGGEGVDPVAGARSARGVRAVPDPRQETVPGVDAEVDTRTGFAASAGTMYGPTGGMRLDREASTVPVHGGRYGYLTFAQYDALSRTQQRKYWVRIKKNEDFADRQRGQAVKRLPVALGNGGAGAQNFTEDRASRDAERLMRQAPEL